MAGRHYHRKISGQWAEINYMGEKRQTYSEAKTSMQNLVAVQATFLAKRTRADKNSKVGQCLDFCLPDS